MIALVVIIKSGSPRLGSTQSVTASNTNGSKPPIYAPRTKKVGVAELKNDLGDLPIYRWLDDKELYVKLLRGKERRRASKFYNTVTESDLAQLLEAGIVEEASRHLKAFVKIFLVSEKGNTRSRVIIEPREIRRSLWAAAPFPREG